MAANRNRAGQWRSLRISFVFVNIGSIFGSFAGFVSGLHSGAFLASSLSQFTTPPELTNDPFSVPGSGCLAVGISKSAHSGPTAADPMALPAGAQSGFTMPHSQLGSVSSHVVSAKNENDNNDYGL